MRVDVIIDKDIFNPFVTIIVFFCLDDSKILGNFYSSSREEDVASYYKRLNISYILYYCFVK